ncbi:MAG: AAA family ATPase, partial [Chloroflexi bacterium]|nr:AAA family ATPase [Chloroflexota bacterium]
MWNIIGQQDAVELLSKSLNIGRVSHAYLLTGPRHVGKMTLAVNLAQALNCTSDQVPCGECESCVRISTGRNSDISLIDLSAESTEIGINQIKEMERLASLKPYESKCRIFIINEAEKLSTEASNCLLKTLEEPPADVIIILLAVKPDSLLPTILSRCQRVDLR